MNALRGPDVKMFVAIGVLMVAWRIAPGPDDPVQSYIIAALYAWFAADLFVSANRQLRLTRGPRPRLGLPPAWLIAWIAVAGLAWAFGTPHVLISYGPEGCFYFGWNGVARYGAGACAGIEMLPLRSG